MADYITECKIQNIILIISNTGLWSLNWKRITAWNVKEIALEFYLLHVSIFK